MPWSTLASTRTSSRSRRLNEASAPLIADWLRQNIPDGILIGPDSESKQWVSDIAIHAVFAQDAYQQVLAAGAARVVSTDSISHASNAISIAALLAQASADFLSGPLGPRI